MITKKQSNTLGLKVAFIPGTNKKPDYYKITQLNNNTSVKISANIYQDMRIYDFIAFVLESIPEIQNFCLVVDNTQNKHYIFSVNFFGPSFLDILHNFKKF